ncbi:Rhs element Vgr protein [Pseudoduganella sp. GCM10020061]|uniref:Rhs element Vgr protein n=1 Tax=Pseudoduganella sp. GCM10020061 TaxID=3317345 RepID=UPI003645319E
MASPVRPMTRGEVEMARLLFRDAVDYERVRIYGRGFLWFGLQHPHVAISPNGNIYFTAARFREDFSRSTDKDMHWFIHEMVHVWQHQLGYPVLMRGALRLFLRYDYVLEEGKRLCDYDMEAQGELLADYFALRYLGNREVMRRSREYGADLSRFERVLAGFLENPGAKVHLPRSLFWRAA